ncbi:hypothetical protein D9758_006097 [Tetrapyrgos nigripes]|uniref:Tetratricopeptide SHNi-TPR domain-containing protein n=1 Tax=Tetrapyrgos nigripes TaxID=182062 RepID=A0A8H5G0A7_9AGAR|nr:hypothetical protein D9758_006097 [Tetrapyrgos nigripes]
MAYKTTKVDSPAPEMTSEAALEQAKRAFALNKYEQAVEHYATALELATQKFAEDSPEIADLYFAYGKALLENAISQNSVLGKEKEKQEEPEEEPKASGSGNAPVLSFSGDAEDLEEEDPAVDLFAQAAKEEAEMDAEQSEEEEDEDAEPEDDFNAAWEVLDLARAIYDKQVQAGSADENTTLKLADIYITLGDVSLETEKFDQAITDYEAGLDLKKKFLPLSSRQIAEAHYKLSIVLDMTPGRLSDAITHAEQAHSSIQDRINALKEGQSNPAESNEAKPDPKGKGKAAAGPSVNDIKNLTPAQIESEIKELTELGEDLKLKIEELKMSPNESLASSAPAMAAQALDKELNAASGSGSSNQVQTNDLTNVVRKKKKNPVPAPESESPTKRKAEGDEAEGSCEKRPKLDSPNGQMARKLPRFFYVTNPSRPTGPRACILPVLIPTSVPNPYLKPSAKRVLAFTNVPAESTPRQKMEADVSDSVTIESVW